MQLKFFALIYSMTFFCQLSYSQNDSTDLNFYATEFVPLTLEDSITFGTSNLSKLHLEFEVDDTTNLGKVWVEILSYNIESEVTTLFYKSYTRAELNEFGFIEDAKVEMELTILELMYTYQIVIRLEDNLGHEKISITKYLAE